ncbi:MAG: valine--tRNA ligase [Chthoniobacterales bacterium]
MTEISKAYEPQAVEEKWYQAWVEADCFKADSQSAKPAFSIVIPPPNVTGVLHLGHVLNNTMQDILCRLARMKGCETLWIPGTDHAGIATQTVVERQLRKEKKLRRRDIGREKFLEHVWEWKQKHGDIIIKQLKKLGCSCDWSRERFTMDEDYSRKVIQTFVDLHKEGLIYRGKRMVNWCPASLTALSDEEVIMKPQKGLLYYFKVEVAEEPGTFLTIATTRPETIPGDTAIAVNPKDPRYAHLIGKHALRPLPKELPAEQRQIPIVGDEHIDLEFGTGVLKVTPAHDKADFEIGQRHKLTVLDIMNPDGTLNEFAGADLAGLERFEARKRAVELLGELGALIKEEPYENNVGFSERADVPIEPRLSEQWFLKYPKVKESLDAVRNGDVKIHPPRWEKVYGHWMENIQDWCISRQLWWGHRIPAWYRKDESGEIYVGTEPPADAENWEQDSDVLDTWFSSWLWPFATMDEETKKKFYPTSVLSTGFDILFFWVARMIMAGYRFTGEKPFSNVIIHNLIRDAQGRKLSKSLGNSPDPLDLIARFGADGVRFGLMRIAPHGQDLRYDEKQIEEGRNFANKLWNAARFRQMQGPSNPLPDLSKHTLPMDSITVVAQFDSMHARLRKAYDEYRFSEAANVLYDFFWGDYCDWFLEASKPDMQGEDAAKRAAILETMDYVLSGFLRLLHPFMPHLTEELWQRLGFHAPTHSAKHENFLMYAALPGERSLSHLPDAEITDAVETTRELYEAAKAARNLRSEFKIASNKAVRFLLRPKPIWKNCDPVVFAALIKAETIECIEQAPSGTPSVVTQIGDLFLPLEGIVDLEAERTRLNGEIVKVEAEIVKAEAKLASGTFVQNAPPAVVAEHRERLQTWIAKREALKNNLETLG